MPRPSGSLAVHRPTIGLRRLQDGPGLEHVGDRAEPAAADDAILVDEEEGPLDGRARPLGNDAGIALDRVDAGEVAQQRGGQLLRVGKWFLRERIVGADAQDLDVYRLELFVVGLPGRQIRGPDRIEVGAVELQEDDLLPTEQTRADRAFRRRREREVGRPVADARLRGRRPRADEAPDAYQD